MVSKIQWKPFWLATKIFPQNDWAGWQIRVNYDVIRVNYDVIRVNYDAFAQASLTRLKFAAKTCYTTNETHISAAGHIVE